MRTLLLVLAAQALWAERAAMLVRFGGDGGDWSGSITPAPTRLYGWQFDEADRVEGAAWKCRTRTETYWDTPYERSMKGTSRREKVTGRGIVIEYDPARAARFEITTAQGSFVVAPGGAQSLLDGRVTVARAAAIEMLTRGPDAEDHPALLAARNGATWLAWISYEAGGDRLFVRRKTGERWGDPEALTEAGGDLFRTCLAEDGGGRIWVIWSAQRDGNFDLYGRHWDGSRWSRIERLTTAAGPDIYPAAAADKQGRVHVAWMSARRGNFDVWTKRWDGKRWSADELVSGSAASDWEPALAAAPDGTVAVLWDTYDRGNYDVVMREWRAGRWSERKDVAASGAFEARASARYDGEGGLWVAFEEGDWNWGKDYGQGVVESGRGLLVRRTARVVRVRNGEVLEPARPLTEALGEEFRQTAVAPRLALDARGTPWVFFRYRVNVPVSRGGPGARAMWRQAATYYADGVWAPAIEFGEGFGRIDAPAAAAATANGRIEVVWPSDGRKWPLAAIEQQDLAWAAFAAAAGRERPLKGFVPSVENLDLSHLKEAQDLTRVKGYRATTGGKQYRVVRGDMHRHTDISWDGNRDGSLHDAYRYALDAAAFEYMGVCDHQAGNMVPYNWWMIQKAVDLFSIPGEFAPLYSYERSLPYPNGHRNVLFAERGRPVLPIGEAEQKGVEGAGKLYAYLRQHGGLTTSHTSATGAGTDWRDSSEDLEPVVEIYQGYRRNYEGPGTPRAPAQGEEPGRFAPGYVWNAWSKDIRMGVQSSSDHVSTHISYAALWVESVDRASIVRAIRARRTYAATDNIVVDWRSGEHMMGESIVSPSAPLFRARVLATAPIDKVVVVRDNRVVYTAPGESAGMSFEWTDRESAAGGKHYYYVRVEQKDGQLAWSSPVWVERRQ